MRKNLPNYILVLVFFIGLSILLYPSVSNYWNSKTQSRAIVDYEAALASLKPEDYTELFGKADEYNRQLRTLSFPLVEYIKIEGYKDQLSLSGEGVIAFIEIDNIDVRLPIYHGTAASILNFAAGHLEGTSLPVGGESTHSVITAHRGLPRSKLFTNIDRLVEGDVFHINVLNRRLTYEVDQILIVKPEEVGPISIVEGEDYMTLLTCTPYGINTHRLLVRGRRVETIGEKEEIYVAPEAFRIEPLIIVPIIAAPMLLILLIILLVKYRKKDEEGSEGGSS